MAEWNDMLESLLEQEAYVIDLLPERVPADADGQYFEVETYWRESRLHQETADRFLRVFLKAMCFYHMAALRDDGPDAPDCEWVDKPDPAWVDATVTELTERGVGRLNGLFPEENALLVFDADDLYLTVYAPPVYMKRLLEGAALGEGLFWRESALGSI